MAQPPVPDSGVEAVPQARLSDALGALDPVSRAVLDLSVRRGIPDADIARLVGADPDRISGRREAALREVGAAVGLTGADELVRVGEALKQMDWRTRSRDVLPGGPPGVAEREGEPQRPKPRTDHALGQARERSVWFFLGAAAVSALVAFRRRTWP
jgi:hypothetical protein